MNSTSNHLWAETNQRHLVSHLARVREALTRHAARGLETSDASPPVDDVPDAQPPVDASTIHDASATHAASIHSDPPSLRHETITPISVKLLMQNAPAAPSKQGGDDVKTTMRRAGVAPEHDGAAAVGSRSEMVDDDEAAPMALDRLCEAFALSSFERDVVLLCAGVELDASLAALCAAAQGDARLAHPTFSRALAALDGAHWSALTPAAPLRRWRLVEIVQAGERLTQSPLRIDERVLHFLAGASYLDERLRGAVEPLAPPRYASHSQRELAGRVAGFWSPTDDTDALPVVFLCGDDGASKRAVASLACASLGVGLHVVHASNVPNNFTERETLACLWQREAVLQRSALLLEINDGESTPALLSFMESVRGLVLVACREAFETRRRPAVRLDVRKPGVAEQQAIWRDALGAAAERLNGQLDAVVSQFSLSAERIHAATVQARDGLRDAPADDDASLDTLLWDACRMQARARLDELAQRIEPVATWDDLVLPDVQLQSLRDLTAHVRQRATVYETWGFAAGSARGLGISALFAGASGTGKTLAAEIIANDLRLDLYRIDLSQVVNKYIGETEKNLRRVFDAAEEGGAVLLFDEADALFGKRSEVKDSHDRYANIEVSYLLQRMESYRGLAILTTNLQAALDTAFLRRLRFVVQFPFPDTAQRAEIWRRIFPPGVPTSNLDTHKLARLSVSGGNIRNIALHAAFLAADAGEPVTMMQLLRAAHSEYAKLEKPLTAAESGGWI